MSITGFPDLFCLPICIQGFKVFLFCVFLAVRAEKTELVHCKYTTSVDIQKRAIKTVHSCRITRERSESARERRIALYKSD